MRKLALWLIVKYRRYVSPLRPPTCRYIPSCSDYAYQAIEKHGFSRGGVMALWRVLRCHPWSRGGYDPVK